MSLMSVYNTSWRADSQAHHVHLRILVVSLTIYCSMWDLMGRDMRFMNLCNILCSQWLIKGKQVPQLMALCLILAIITEHTWPVLVWMENTGQLRRFPTLLKTVKIKQPKPYYRSLREHCWVSRERETEREWERERGKEKSCQSEFDRHNVYRNEKPETESPHSSGFMTSEWEMLLLCTSFPATSARPMMVVNECRLPPQFQNKTIY